MLARTAVWPDIKRALAQKPHMKGHLPCFCEKRDKIRRCHPARWQGCEGFKLTSEHLESVFHRAEA